MPVQGADSQGAEFLKRPTREGLEHRRGIVIADLVSKVEAEDWHGVADAAMDLREIDAQLRVVEA